MDFSFETWFYLTFAVLILSLIGIGLLIHDRNKTKNSRKAGSNTNHELVKLKLQALERFTLYAERSFLKNLVSRTPADGLTVVGLQLNLLEALRSEYEYNVTQQIYIDPKLWQAIGNLKDQNTYIINQLAAMLPSNANGIELSKSILEYAAGTESELSSIVLEALRYEAKKLL
jgi:hypothetical protein